MPSSTRLARPLSPLLHPVLLVVALLVGLAASAGCGDRSDILPIGFIDGSVPDGQADVVHRDAPRRDSPAARCEVTCTAGCCTPEGECLSGTSSDSCGAGGIACAVCPATATCNGAHTCVSPGPCGPATCPGGCCDDTGTCQSGVSLSACGGGGGACENCLQPGFTSCDQGSRTCVGVSMGCSPENCPVGCCEPTPGGLECIGLGPTTCGLAGQICQNCAAEGQTCDPNGQCTTPSQCGADNCPGCCLDDQCVIGGDQGACGNDGVQCVFCPPGETCNGGVCEEEIDGGGCGPETCAGCCGVTGECRAGTHTRSCGTGGEECADCAPDGTCSDGVCVFTEGCNEGSCPDGCCDGSGNCQAGDTLAACGAGGNTCAACLPGAMCTGGTCQNTTMPCGPTTCKGCCDAGGNCQAGDTVNDCGAQGKACSTCPSGDACVGTVFVSFVCQGSTCLESCAEGCCDQNDVCQPGNTNQACGEGGQCAVCSPGAFCEGECEDSTCSAATCPTGCCDGNGACQPGNQTFDCGTGGGFCNSCDATSQCIAGNCQETGCNEETCPGCCDQNDNCQTGESSAACGSGGDECNACPATSSCSEGECVGFTCSATTCPMGCCDSSGNCQTGFGLTGGTMCPCSATCQGCCDTTGDCRAGTIDDACGSGGASCADCVTQNETCDNDVFPVVCDQSCPSPYTGCPAGTTIPAPQLFGDACHQGDLEDAAAACAAGAETDDCNDFFSGEFEANANCANCLEQFDFDFVDLTGIYTCAEPFLSGACDGETGCANNCASTVCQSCSGDPTTCENTAIAGECATLVTAANKCVAASAPATMLCAQASYPNFGAWLSGVGNHYCGQ